MSFKESMNINNENNGKNGNINDGLDTILLQLIEMGYDNKYSKRVVYYFHPDDLEEALNYMEIENGIIQHRFIRDNKDVYNKSCFICGENEDIHLKELNFIHPNNNINRNINNEFKNNNDKNLYNDTTNMDHSSFNLKNDINIEDIIQEIYHGNNFFIWQSVYHINSLSSHRNHKQPLLVFFTNSVPFFLPIYLLSLPTSSTHPIENFSASPYQAALAYMSKQTADYPSQIKHTPPSLALSSYITISL